MIIPSLFALITNIVCDSETWGFANKLSTKPEIAYETAVFCFDSFGTDDRSPKIMYAARDVALLDGTPYLGNWAKQILYNTGDLVTHNDRLWMALTSTNGTAPNDTPKWKSITIFFFPELNPALAYCDRYDVMLVGQMLQMCMAEHCNFLMEGDAKDWKYLKKSTELYREWFAAASAVLKNSDLTFNLMFESIKSEHYLVIGLYDDLRSIVSQDDANDLSIPNDFVDMYMKLEH